MPDILHVLTILFLRFENSLMASDIGMRSVTFLFERVYSAHLDILSEQIDMARLLR